MDLIEGYQSSSSSDRNEFELGRRKIRKVYLATYSQANKSKAPTRNAFAEAVITSLVWVRQEFYNAVAHKNRIRNMVCTIICV